MHGKISAAQKVMSKQMNASFPCSLRRSENCSDEWRQKHLCSVANAKTLVCFIFLSDTIWFYCGRSCIRNHLKIQREGRFYSVKIKYGFPVIPTKLWWREINWKSYPVKGPSKGSQAPYVQSCCGVHIGIYVNSFSVAEKWYFKSSIWWHSSDTNLANNYTRQPSGARRTRAS